MNNVQPMLPQCDFLDVNEIRVSVMKNRCSVYISEANLMRSGFHADSKYEMNFRAGKLQITFGASGNKPHRNGEYKGKQYHLGLNQSAKKTGLPKDDILGLRNTPCEYVFDFGKDITIDLSDYVFKRASLNPSSEERPSQESAEKHYDEHYRAVLTSALNDFRDAVERVKSLNTCANVMLTDGRNTFDPSEIKLRVTAFEDIG